MALDIGQARIGVAVSDPTGTIAQPLCVLNRVNREQDIRALARLAALQKARLLVLGLPKQSAGAPGRGRRSGCAPWAGGWNGCSGCRCLRGRVRDHQRGRGGPRRRPHVPRAPGQGGGHAGRQPDPQALPGRPGGTGVKLPRRPVLLALAALLALALGAGGLFAGRRALYAHRAVPRTRRRSWWNCPGESGCGRWPRPWPAGGWWTIPGSSPWPPGSGATPAASGPASTPLSRAKATPSSWTTWWPAGWSSISWRCRGAHPPADRRPPDALGLAERDEVLELSADRISWPNSRSPPPAWKATSFPIPTGSSARPAPAASWPP